MNDVEPMQGEVNLPALPEQMFTEIASITSALGIPRDVLGNL